ncbi:MAG: hypothetical protein VX189_15230, partial [Planctomycetota bacterium]|nr:hypothetical protein [Planctomycetota bacterium]
NLEETSSVDTIAIAALRRLGAENGQHGSGSLTRGEVGLPDASTRVPFLEDSARPQRFRSSGGSGISAYKVPVTLAMKKGILCCTRQFRLGMANCSTQESCSAQQVQSSALARCSTDRNMVKKRLKPLQEV